MFCLCRRTLLIVYPGPDEMAANALKHYKGNTLIYVGMSRHWDQRELCS